MYRALLTLPDIRYHCERSKDTVPSPICMRLAHTISRHSGDRMVMMMMLSKTSSSRPLQSSFRAPPHRGSAYAPLGETFRRIASAVGFDSNDSNLRTPHFDSIV